MPKAPAARAPRKPQKKCLHGRQKRYCRDCGGTGFCEHGRQKHTCKQCGGSSICEHNRVRSECKECGGNSICEHGRVRSKCKECKGSEVCEHGRHHSVCKQCCGSQVCEHDRRRSKCKECKGGSICEHGRVRGVCKECGGSGICEHNRLRIECKDCCGSQICEHNRLRKQCKDCCGSSICKHGRQRGGCRICNVQHPYHGVAGHQGRASDFEHVMMEAFKEVTPPWAKTTEQFRVNNPNGLCRCFRIDLVVELSRDYCFAIEFDGQDHYPDGKRVTLNDPIRQLKRDRYIEQWCLKQGMSCFRVPYICRTKNRRRPAVEYIIAAACRDYEDNVARVHYIEFERTYADINKFAVDRDGVERIDAKPYSDLLTTYTKSL